jgi:hypothetical protein
MISAKEFQAKYGRGQPTAAAPAKAKTIPKPTAGDSPTNALTKAVLYYCHLNGIRAWRQNNAAVYDPTRQCFRANSSTPGISDVLGYCLRTGRIIAIEIKTGRDTLSTEQRAFLAGIRLAGGFACEGRDIIQIQQELSAWRAALP